MKIVLFLALFLGMPLFGRSSRASGINSSNNKRRRGLRGGSSSSPPSPPASSVRAAAFLPDESAPHAATWLQWPHPYAYGTAYRNGLEPTWVEMTKALVVGGEPFVNVIAYDETVASRAERLLEQAGVCLDNVEFILIKTNGVWVRDDGPVFVQNNKASEGGGDVEILDWGFNGWGYDAPYRLDNEVPASVSEYLNMTRIDLTDVVLEGGAIEVDGRGTLMATRSSVLENGRNRDVTQQEMEDLMLEYMGVEQVIWLDGKYGGKEDITDYHVDGFARFGDPNTIVTMSDSDLLYWGISRKDVNTLYGAVDTSGRPYDFVQLPLSRNDVVTTWGENLGFRGSYVNFYTGNTVVLVPSYDDPNDEVARGILQDLYPDREVVLIDSRNLIQAGGVIHCVTKQQAMPASSP